MSYYAVLGVAPGASAAEIRAAFRRLAKKWHPDKKGVDPRMAEEAKGRFQQIHEAYQVLSDEKKRALYDAGMYDPVNDDDEEEVEGFHDFLQEMLSLMATVRREEPVYSLHDLQSMLDEMMANFAPSTQPSPTLFTGGFAFATSNSQQHSSSYVNQQGVVGNMAYFSRAAYPTF